MCTHNSWLYYSCCVLWIRVSGLAHVVHRTISGASSCSGVIETSWMRCILLSPIFLGFISADQFVDCIVSQNGGTNCPACRGQSTTVTPFRALQSVIDSLLRAAPHKARTERERQQADEIYKLGHSMRVRPRVSSILLII